MPAAISKTLVLKLQGRHLRVPAGLRRYLAEDLYITSLTGETARIYPIKSWIALEERLAAVGKSPARDKFMDRVFYFGDMASVDHDRIQLPRRIFECSDLPSFNEAFAVRMPDGCLEVSSFRRLNDIARHALADPNYLKRLFGSEEDVEDCVIGAFDECRNANVERAFSELRSQFVRALATRPERLLKISPRYFEHFVAEVLRTFGFEVELTARTRDGGLDMLAIRSTNSSTDERFVVECKRWAPHRKVSIELVRALYGVKALTGADRAIFVTTSSFTGTAWKLARHGQRCDLHLIDFQGLRAWLTEYLRQPASNPAPTIAIFPEDVKGS